MDQTKIIPSIILIALGIFFFINNKAMGKGAAKFYQWFYTEERVIIMFKMVGIILIIGGVLLLIIK
jgi:hypothetical protein